MNSKYRNTAFLAEVLVNILVFSIACAILVGAFAQASIMVRESREKSLATAEVYSLLETMKVRGPGSLGAQEQADGSLLLTYDAGWQRLQSGDAAFEVRIVIASDESRSGTLHHVTATACRLDGGEELCRLDTAFYEPREGAG